MIQTMIRLAALRAMLFAMLFTMWTASSEAATVQCHAVEGDRITAADLAAVLPAFAAIAPDTPIGYAPQPGAYRNMEPAELTRLAAANGFEFHGIEAVCFEPALVELRASRIEASIRESLDAMAISNADIDIIEYSKFRVPEGTLSFPVESLPPFAPENTAIWNGFVEHENHRYPVWARVRIGARQVRVVATVNLRAGQRVEASDVRLEESKIFPSRTMPLKALSEGVGKLAKRYLTAGTPVGASDLMEPFDVDRGDIVTVEVQSGGAVLLMEAEAQAAGRRGQNVTLRNAASGKIFRAKITGKGRALLECSSAGI